MLCRSEPKDASVQTLKSLQQCQHSTIRSENDGVYAAVSPDVPVSDDCNSQPGTQCETSSSGYPSRNDCFQLPKTVFLSPSGNVSN